MEVFTMVGRTWNVRVMSLFENGEVLDSDKSGRGATGNMVRDIIGTYYNYTITVKPKKSHLNEYDEFWNAVTSPVESHQVSFPHNQSYLTFNAYITSASREIKIVTEDGFIWKPMTLNFIAMEPQRISLVGGDL